MTTDRQTSPILLRNTLAFDRQQVAEFKRAIVNAVEFANRHAPQLRRVCKTPFARPAQSDSEPALA